MAPGTTALCIKIHNSSSWDFWLTTSSPNMCTRICRCFTFIFSRFLRHWDENLLGFLSKKHRGDVWGKWCYNWKQYWGAFCSKLKSLKHLKHENQIIIICHKIFRLDSITTIRGIIRTNPRGYYTWHEDLGQNKRPFRTRLYWINSWILEASGLMEPSCINEFKVLSDAAKLALISWNMILLDLLKWMRALHYVHAGLT